MLLLCMWTLEAPSNVELELTHTYYKKAVVTQRCPRPPHSEHMMLPAPPQPTPKGDDMQCVSKQYGVLGCVRDDAT